MSKQVFLPESMYQVDSKMTYKKLKTFYKKKSIIIGRVIRLNLKDEIFEVDLGASLIGIMPFEDSTIYPIYKDNGNISYHLITLVGKTIQARIRSLGNNIVLSRKANMLHALETIKKQTEIRFSSITGFSQSSVFIDIGAGIIGKSATYNFSNIVFRQAKDVGFKKYDILPVKITQFQNEINCFDLSVVNVFPSFHEALNENDIVTCKVFGSLDDGIGYYVLINQKYCGIVDSPSQELQYGDEISATIHKITDRGPRLKLVEKL